MKVPLAASQFFDRFHNIFSLNYDLLPYWINMMGNPPVYQDGFREDPDEEDAPSLVFTERIGDERGLYFPHGALHIFMDSAGLRKHCWARTQKRLTDLIREGLEQGRYPLFVAEGDSEKQMYQIHQSGYLSYCYGNLGRIEQRLVTFGFSFGPTDRHIGDVIANNHKLTELFVGVYGPNGEIDEALFQGVESVVSARTETLRGRPFRYQEKHQLTVTFFDSQSAKVWS